VRSGFTGKKNLFVASVPIYVRIYKYTKVVFAVALMFFDGIFGRSQKMQAGNPCITTRFTNIPSLSFLST
jgi:hypothetical protein